MSHESSEIKGSGIGMALSKRLADNMGLELHFESELNKGTTFILVLQSRKVVD